ncbi:MAG TPA: hypothetical protein VK165_04850 [Azonexus sp.]|nr:hypothetical protein [Azonexus sp.]
MLQFEQLSAMSETSRNATRQLAQATLEGQERMLRVNIDAMEEFIKAGGEQLKETCADMTLLDSAKIWPQVVMSNIQRSTALNLSLIEITRRMQLGLTCAVEENLRALRDGTLEAVEVYSAAAKSLPAQAEGGSRSLKQAA